MLVLPLFVASACQPVNPSAGDDEPRVLVLVASSLGEIVDDQFTVSDKIAYILDQVDPGGTISFIDLFKSAASKNEMIVTFLAVLELMKLNYFKVQQKVVLGEINLRRTEF